MALYSNYFVVELFGIILAVICAFYMYMKNVTFNHWSSRNVPFVKPIVPFGSIWPVFSRKSSLGEFIRDSYLKFKKSPIFGIYSLHKPTLVINDPDLIRLILTKEFGRFHDRGLYCNEKIDPMSAHMFFVPGAKWRYLRTKFSPTFTSSKMKQMFFTVKECADMMAEYLAEKAKDSEVVEIRDLIARYTTDVIASAAFGVNCNSIKNPDAEFRKWGRKFFESRLLINTLMFMAPKLLQVFKIPFNDRDTTNFFISAFKETVEYRTANNVVRKDFLNLIMQLMAQGHVEDDDVKQSGHVSEVDTEKLSMLDGAAQAFLFWLAGFETSSSTASHCLYELAQHQDMQDKAAEEIRTVLKEFGGTVTYESLNQMKCLNKLVSETLRKYPPVAVLNRECTADFDLPGTGFRVEKGTAIMIPVFGIHNDPDIYPHPEKFDPERFNEENIASRHQYVYLPFGEGPRNCIGMRFGLVQTKVGLASLLSKYRFLPGPSFTTPMPMEKGSLVTTHAGGINLRIAPR